MHGREASELPLPHPTGSQLSFPSRARVDLAAHLVFASPSSLSDHAPPRYPYSSMSSGQGRTPARTLSRALEPLRDRAALAPELMAEPPFELDASASLIASTGGASVTSAVAASVTSAGGASVTSAVAASVTSTGGASVTSTGDAIAPFRGALGATRSAPVRVRSGNALISVEVYLAVNADTDPELGRRARGELSAPLHTLHLAGETIELAIPLLYHEPSRGLFVLVLPPALRHRELDERVELLRQLQAVPADIPIPEYVSHFDVVIGAAGPAGLTALRELRALRARGERDPQPALAVSAKPTIPSLSSLALLGAAPDSITDDATAATAAPGSDTSGDTGGETGSGNGASAALPGDSAESLDGSVDRAIDAAMDADYAASLAAASAAPSSAALPESSLGGPLDGSIRRPIEVASDAFALRVAELSAWQQALEVRAAELEQRTGALARRESALQDRQRRTLARERAASELDRAEEAPVVQGGAGDSGATPGLVDSSPAVSRVATVAGPVPVAIAAAPRPAFLPAVVTPAAPLRPTSSLSGTGTGSAPASLSAGPLSGPLTIPGEPALDPASGPTGGPASGPTNGASPAPTSGPPPSLEPGPRPARAFAGAGLGAAHGLTSIVASPAAVEVSDASGTPDTIDEDLSAGLSRAGRELPLGADPITTEAREQPIFEPDAWLSSCIAADECDLTVEHGRARIALSSSAIGDPGALRGPLDVRIVLHRTPSFPILVLLFGSPAGLRSERRDQLAAMCLDVTCERDRDALHQLAKSFEIVLEIFARGRWIRRVLLSAPLADNVAYLLRAADDYLHQLDERDPDGRDGRTAERAIAEIASPGYDILGIHHPDAATFRDDQLVAVRTAGQLLFALSIAQRFARPDGEDYLVCVRGFPLLRWRRLRRHVLEQAVTWGIWMGSELARVAVSEGLARSRRDLVHKLHDGFELLQRHPTACDLDEVALAENADALALEARALGVVPGKARTLFDSEMDSVVAGTIDLVPSGPILPVTAQTLSELVASLEDPQARLAAALELCRRQAELAAQPVIAALPHMGRTEAVQVLAASVRLGLSVEEPLIAALASSKAYVRQGAALALSLLRGDEGAAAVVALLLTEPTEIWKEVARALGQVGPAALHHLARTVRDEGSSAIVEERVAWALAHLGARDCHKAIVQMSSGHSIMAPIAAKALLLVEPAARDHQALLSDDSHDELTVHRSFSKQFFAAVAGNLGSAFVEGPAPLEGSQVIALDGGARGQRRQHSESDA